MAQIYINRNIRLNRQGLQVRDDDQKWIDLHCQQGRLDGACAIYCTTMALLCLGQLDENDISIYNPIDRRTPKGKFLNEMFNEQGLVKDGFHLRTMRVELNKFFKDIVAKHPNKTDEFIDKAVSAVSNDNSVILGLENTNDEKWGHAIFMVGYEADDEGNATKLLCLDPGYSCAKTAYWNCIIDLTKNSGSDNPYWYINEECSIPVMIGDILTLELKI